MSHRKTKILFILSIALLVGVCFLYAILFSSIKEKNENISSITNQIYFENIDINRKQELLQLVRTTRGYKEVIDSLFVQREELSEFLSYIEGLNNDSVSLEISKVTEQEDGPLLIEINSTGLFEDLFVLMSVLENSPYGLQLKQFSFNKAVLSDEELANLGNRDILWNGDFVIELISFLP